MPSRRGQYKFARQRPSGPSTCVQFLRFEVEDSVLKVVFTDGSVYEYDGVDEDTFQAFRDAASRGSFFNSEIRDRFSYTRTG